MTMRRPPASLHPDRRRLLGLALAVSVPGAWRPPAARAQAKLPADPFALGVASAPAGPGAVLLWTRIAPEIGSDLARFSGLPLEAYLAVRKTYRQAPEPFEVRWELAEDDGFRRIVRRGTSLAPAELAHSVHVELGGLDPGRTLHYRFHLGAATSPVGRTRALPQRAARLRFALASCQHYEHGFFGAYNAMCDDDPELVAFVGDYIYEGGPSNNRMRAHPFPSARTLFDYRLRHALYKRDPGLQRMHASCPWILTWDDHEVSNDYARDTGEDPRVDGAARRAAAYQAYYEHMPLPASALVERFAHVSMYRSLDVGGLARFVVLDDRQYRDRQACQPEGRGGSSVVDDRTCPERRDARRTLLGAQQTAWLEQQLRSHARWNFVTQQTLFSPLTRDGRRYWTDGWDGYPAQRTRVLAALRAGRTSNPVFLGGDLHTTYVCDVKADYDDPRAPLVASEFCGTSITSPTSLDPRRIAALVAANPHVRFGDGAHRGYLLADVSTRSLQVRLRAADDVTRREPNVGTLAVWSVEHGRPGAQPG